MHIKFIPQEAREARLANVRLVLMKDPRCQAPDKDADLIFHRGHGEVFGFTLKENYGFEKEVFTASRAKVDEESKACGHKTEAEKLAWLDGIKKAEARLWQAWMDGEVYAIYIQKWNPLERQFCTVDCQFGLYGWDDLVDCLKDMDLDGVEKFCVDSSCGNLDSWRQEFRELDIEPRVKKAAE